MSLIHVDPRFLDRVWPLAAQMLQPAVDEARGEITIDQLELLIRRGESNLLRWEEVGEITGAVAVEFHNFPSMRVAHVSFLGGKGVVDEKHFSALKEWCVSQGASEMRAWCAEAQAKLFQSIGFVEQYRIVGVKLC